APAQQGTSIMKAGEIDDNALWADYLKYRDEHSNLNFHPVDVSERYIISVTSALGTPILGARVRVYADNQSLLSETHTYANGKTLFSRKGMPGPANAPNLNVVVDKAGVPYLFVLPRHEQENWEVALSGQTQLASTQKPQVKLDVLFLLDTTGSM